MALCDVVLHIGGGKSDISWLVIYLPFQHILNRRELGGVSSPWKCVLCQLSVQYLFHSGVLCKDLLRHPWYDSSAHALINWNLHILFLSHA